MKYNELLELYKQNALNQEEMKRVEAEIERQEAISEYLFDRDETQESSFAPERTQGDGDGAEDFVKMIHRSIRRAFIKMGAVVAIVTLMITLFVFWVLPEMVDSFYYDPGASVGREGNQLSLDLAVYTELRMPNCNRNNVFVENRGYGEYDISIQQNVSYNSRFTNLTGKVEKGNLILYDTNIMKAPTGNVFAWYQMEGDSRDTLRDLIEAGGRSNYCAAGEVDRANETLQGLDEHEKYVAYVSLNKMMRYEDFMAYLETSEAGKSMNNLWCAVCTMNGVADVDTSHNGVLTEENDMSISMFRAENIGFNCVLTQSHALDWNREEYPDLLLWDDITLNAMEENIREGHRELCENMKKEEFMKRHFVSMLRYMADREEFLDMMSENAEKYRNAADYVEEHGIMVYGFAGIAEKESILRLNAEDAVYEIYVNELK